MPVIPDGGFRSSDGEGEMYFGDFLGGLDFDFMRGFSEVGHGFSSFGGGFNAAFPSPQ